MTDDLDARITAVLAECKDCWPNAATGFKAVRLLSDVQNALITLSAERDAAHADISSLQASLQGEVEGRLAAEAERDAAIARAEAAERASRELWAAIDKHEAWLKHEHAVCDAAGDRAGVIAYARAVNSLRAALGERRT
jgi:hypothetical protein